MKNKLKDIPLSKILRFFYLAGTIIFIVVGIANAFTNVTLWEKMLLSSKVSAAASNIFNFVLAFVFYNLFIRQKVSPAQELNPEKIESAIEEGFNK